MYSVAMVCVLRCRTMVSVCVMCWLGDRISNSVFGFLGMSNSVRCVVIAFVIGGGGGSNAHVINCSDNVP